MMGVFCDRLSFGSIAALNCHTGQDKGRYCEKELLLLLVLLRWSIMTTVAWSVGGSFEDCFGESLGGHVVFGWSCGLVHGPVHSLFIEGCSQSILVSVGGLLCKWGAGGGFSPPSF